mmetsp:Transcript_26521/g.57578  ORF Transcript_26521/g.57578 Transcript_26521/m.57578 type:complete len:368 (+) Transcript_26521:222-1325(+)
MHPSSSLLGHRRKCCQRVDGFPRLDVLLPGLEAPEGLAGALSDPLPVERHNDKDGGLDLHENRSAAVHSRTAHLETLGESLGIHGVGDVNDKVQLALLQHVEHVRLTVHTRLVSQNDVADAALGHEELARRLCGVELEAHVDQHLGVLEDLGLLLRGSDRDQDVLRGELEAGGEHGLEEGFVLILAEASDLAGRLHLDTQAGVGVLQPGEGEDRHLGRDAIHIDGLDGGRVRRQAQHDARRHVDEVHVVGLGDERERSGGSQVALDHHHLVLLAHKLDVEGSRDVQGSAKLLADALDSSMGLHEQLLSWEQQRRVATVHAGVLDVLGDGVVHQLTLLANGIQLDLLCSRDVLRDDDRVVSADNGGSP